MARLWMRPVDLSSGRGVPPAASTRRRVWGCGMRLRKAGEVRPTVCDRARTPSLTGPHPALSTLR